ncbi:hypothetical protein GCM10027615_78890 [Plantactinospora veratri]
MRSRVRGGKRYGAARYAWPMASLDDLVSVVRRRDFRDGPGQDTARRAPRAGSRTDRRDQRRPTDANGQPTDANGPARTGVGVGVWLREDSSRISGVAARADTGRQEDARITRCSDWGTTTAVR